MQTATLETPAKSKTLPVIAKAKEANKAKAKKSVQSVAKPDAPKDGEIVGFDYSKIVDPEVSATVHKIATRIKGNLRQEKALFLDTGKALIEAKAVKGFGLFDKWVAQEFPFSKRAAINYMSLAREFGETYELVSYLPAQTLYKLAEGKTLKDVRAKVINAAKSGKPLGKSNVQLLLSTKRATTKGMPAPKIGTDKEADARMEAARSAVALLREKLDEDFPRFVAWFHDAGEAFTVALKEAA